MQTIRRQRTRRPSWFFVTLFSLCFVVAYLFVVVRVTQSATHSWYIKEHPRGIERDVVSVQSQQQTAAAQHTVFSAHPTTIPPHIKPNKVPAPPNSEASTVEQHIVTHAATTQRPTATAHLRPTVVETTRQTPEPKKRTRAPTSSSVIGAEVDCALDGVDLRVHDAATSDHPGGTEAAALQFRRALQKHQWPEVHDIRNIRWRTLPTTAKSEIGSGWNCLQRQQHEHPSLKLVFDDVSTACPDAHDFRCRVVAYADRFKKRSRSSGATSQWEMCDSVYGASLLKRFTAGAVQMCQPPTGAVTCKLVLAHQSHETQTAVCSVQNASVNFQRITNGDFPWLQFSRGAMTVRCEETERGTAIRSAPGTFIHCLADWMELGYDTKSAMNADGDGHENDCDSWDETPTIFVTRSGDYSPFALTHDWLNTVVLMSVEGLKPSDVQIVVMDRMTAGFYLPVWQVAFSPARPLLWYPDLAEQPSRRCYRRAWFNIPARMSPIYNEDECGTAGDVYRSPLYHVFRDHILASFHALHVVGRVTPTHDPRFSVVVTLIMRRNYATGHSIGRRFGNGDALTRAIRDKLRILELYDVASDNNKVQMHVVVNQVDYADHNFDAQLNISRSTDLLIAMHGAGLAHAMYLHEWAGIFEFFCPEKPSSNYRYHQLASKMGLLYDSYSITTEDNVVPLNDAIPQIARLAAGVAELKFRTLGGS